MAIERRAVKKRVLKSGRDRTDTAVYVLLKYGITDDADQAQKLVQSKDEVLFPSDLSYYSDQVDQDLGMGKTSPEVEKIRNALAEFYGLYEPEQETEEEVRWMGFPQRKGPIQTPDDTPVPKQEVRRVLQPDSGA